jgi:hypothetical protein
MTTPKGLHMKFQLRPVLIAAIVLTVVGVAACGGGSSKSAAGSTASASTSPAASAASASAGGSGDAGGRQNPYADPTVQACLKAAGIAVPTFGGNRPSGAGTGERPSGFPSGTFSRPSGAPTGSFTRGAGGGAGGFGGTDSPEFQQIQQALTACGITLPSFTRGAGAPVPSGAPTS